MDNDEGQNMLRSLRTLVAVCIFAPGFAAASGFVDTPDQCYGLDRIVKEGIYLKQISKCEGRLGRFFVENKPGETRKIFINGSFWSEQTVKSMEVIDVSNIGERAQVFMDKIKIPVNPHEEAMTIEAAKTKAVSESPEFIAKVEAETRRIGENTLGEQFASYYKDNIDVKSLGNLNADERVYIFVSESMPMPVLRQYAADMARLGDTRVTMVLRGFIGGMTNIGPTAGFVAKVTVKDASCDLAGGVQCPMMSSNVIVDPLLFRRYQISHVPAFVYARGVSISNPDQSEGTVGNTKVDDFFSISGDVSLKYVFKQFGEATGEERLNRRELP